MREREREREREKEQRLRRQRREPERYKKKQLQVDFISSSPTFVPDSSHSLYGAAQADFSHLSAARSPVFRIHAHTSDVLLSREERERGMTKWSSSCNHNVTFVTNDHDYSFFSITGYRSTTSFSKFTDRSHLCQPFLISEKQRKDTRRRK